MNKVGIKRRVERIMNDRKTGRITFGVFVITCAALVFFLMTNNVAIADDKDGLADIDPSRFMVIRAADGTVVEAFETEEEGYLEPAAIPPHSITSSVQAEDLLLIKEEVLREGVYRSSATLGEPVHALSTGVVVDAGFSHGSGFGYCVTIEDEDGRVWRYGHCCELVVAGGDNVVAGDLIAYAGVSGYASEPTVDIRVVR